MTINYRIDQNQSYLHYSNFALGSAKEQYPLILSGSESIGKTDPLQNLKGLKFASRDRGSRGTSISCARVYGRFWHPLCGCGALKINENNNNPAIVLLNSEWLRTVIVEMKIRLHNYEKNYIDSF